VCALKSGASWVGAVGVVSGFMTSAPPTPPTPPPTTPPPTPPTPPPTPSCTGNSKYLNKASCDAWQDLANYTKIAGWDDCSGNLLDPCSCDGVTCADGDITAL
jgi:hypothetical protein